MSWDNPLCEVEGCEREHYSKGMCQAHYRRKARTGSVGSVSVGSGPGNQRERAMCTFSECPYPTRSAGLCDAHAKQRARGSVLKPIRLKTAAPIGRRESNLRAKYNITAAIYAEMFSRQGGVCMICKQPPRAGVKYHSELHVDHDRACCPSWKSCGKCVRGLLCKMCNVGIGNLGDDPERLDSAARYLRAWRDR